MAGQLGEKGFFGAVDVGGIHVGDPKGRAILAKREVNGEGVRGGNVVGKGENISVPG